MTPYEAWAGKTVYFDSSDSSSDERTPLSSIPSRPAGLVWHFRLLTLAMLGQQLWPKFDMYFSSVRVEATTLPRWIEVGTQYTYNILLELSSPWLFLTVVGKFHAKKRAGAPASNTSSAFHTHNNYNVPYLNCSMLRLYGVNRVPKYSSRLTN
jgi:hypothetical protein